LLTLSVFVFFFSSRRRHTRFSRDWSSDVCSSDLLILMNVAQSHFPDVAWLLGRFPLSRRAFTSTSRAVQAQMCLQGMGIAVLPRPLGDAISALQRIETPEPLPTRDIWVGYHHDLRHMDRLRAMLDIADTMLSDSANAPQ